MTNLVDIEPRRGLSRFFRPRFRRGAPSLDSELDIFLRKIPSVTKAYNFVDRETRNLQKWAVEMYVTIFDSPNEQRNALLQNMVKRNSPDEVSTVALTLLRFTNGYDRENWFPQLVHLFMDQYKLTSQEGGQAFFRGLWSTLIDLDKSKWLRPSLRDSIVGALTPFVNTPETFDGKPSLPQYRFITPTQTAVSQ